MKFAFIFFSLLIYQSLFSQDEEPRSPSKESLAYHEARMKLTIPPYGLPKIKSLINKLEADESESERIDNKIYAALPLREKFTYNMIHCESYSQNCDPAMPIPDEHIKIFANLPDPFDEYNWSDRQIVFFIEHKDSVMSIMKESIARTGKVGLNYKHAILEINALDMIPALLDAYKKSSSTKDLDILTVFMQLMKENKYQPFMESTSCTKLYSDNSDYFAYLNYSKANEDLIIKRVSDFYSAQKK